MSDSLAVPLTPELGGAPEPREDGEPHFHLYFLSYTKSLCIKERSLIEGQNKQSITSAEGTKEGSKWSRLRMKA